jgi:cytosine deaminase
MVEAQLHATPNPLINITLQGRHDSYPKRRGMTRVPELRAAGINVSFGHDCVMDPWYPLGQGDMLEAASMGIHVGLMTNQEQMSWAFDAVTVNPAKAMHLEGYGLEKGCNADFVILQAKSPVEALRLKANRLKVVKRGKVIAETPERVAALHLDGRPKTVNGADYAPKG